MKLIHKESKQDFIPKEVTKAYNKEQDEIRKQSLSLNNNNQRNDIKSNINQKDINKYMLSK